MTHEITLDLAKSLSQLEAKTIPGLAEWTEAPFDVEPPVEILTPDSLPKGKRITRQLGALDAVRALDQALTLTAVCDLDREALAKFQSILYHWQQIAVEEMARRREVHR